MAFNKSVKDKILVDRQSGERFPCVMCGGRFPLPEAAHIIDFSEWKERIGSDRQVNGIPLCPNCHKVFDEVLRPYLYNALKHFGIDGLPDCWKKSNKISEITGFDLPIDTE